MKSPTSAFLFSSRALLVLALVGSCAAAPASSIPPPEKIAIWNNPAEDGVVYYHIPELLVTQRGTVLACCEARHAHGDGTQVDIVVRRSADGGHTWSASQYLERTVGKENYVLPVLIQERQTGRLFFFCALRDEGLKDKTTSNYYRTSDDDGVTWSERVDITKLLVDSDQKLQAAIAGHRAAPQFQGDLPEAYGRELFFFGPGRPIQLSSRHPTHPNRLVIPVFAIKDRTSLPRTRRGYGDAVLLSDDRGATWRVGGTVPIGDIVASEVSVVELEDGRLLLNSRETPDRAFLDGPARRTVATSADGGESWTRAVADSSGIPPFFETHAGLLRVSGARTEPAGKSRLLFSFPAGPKRTHGTLLLSYDDHQSWAVRKEIEPGDFSYSNLDQLPDGTIVLIYGDGTKVWLARFTLEWLTDGHDHAERSAK